MPMKPLAGLFLALACLLARGHLLIEDLPGVGKSTLAEALAGMAFVQLVSPGAPVVLGSFALKRGRSLKARWLCFIAALCVYAFMLSVARSHQPLGWFY